MLENHSVDNALENFANDGEDGNRSVIGRF